ncbi:MAG: HD domain-containing protein [Prevotellaceae bacterium]|nr:HD domain-containing protein [Prevotellaceae bacterium]
MEEDYQSRINRSVEELFHAIAGRMSPDDMRRIRDAYEFAREAHKDQRRKSGEPYIMHPIAVARILAEELELSANPIIAAFLHDVVEDTPHTFEEIQARYGDDVAFLVRVVTKQKKQKYEESKQVDNFRQILASVQFDLRAILLKLADRLHNMRTLASMRPDKQMKIAGETDYFYAPLANRLGLYHVKTELEDLSFKYRCPREYEQMRQMLEQEKEQEKEHLDDFAAKVKELLDKGGIPTRIELRYRMPYSICRKMRSKNCDFHHADGKHYIRIIYEADGLQEEKKKSLHIYGVLTDYFKERPGSVANYINAPKENGYQSFHVKLLNEQGEWEEMHIASERMVRNSRLGCAAEQTEENVMAWLEKFKEVLQDAAYHTQEMDYMDGVTASFYNDDIMVFTPQGKEVILPKGATALDFAFEMLGEEGLHAFFARINGKLCSVKTVLHRGDCVETITQPAASPQEEWLAHVSTYKAKCTLRSHFAKKEKLAYLRCDRCHPLPGDELIGFKDDRGKITLHKRNCPEAVRMASQQGDSIVAVNFEEQEAFLFPVRICIRSIDRHHLLRDVVACITEKQNLSISRLTTTTVDNIVETSVDFAIHSENELEQTMNSIAAIENVDEVARIDIE